MIVDAVFASAAERDAIEAVARRAGVPFIGIWLDAPPAVCIERVESRHGDASDADAEVVRAQVVRDSGVVHWRRLNAAGPPEHTMRAAQSLVGLSSD